LNIYSRFSSIHKCWQMYKHLDHYCLEPGYQLRMACAKNCLKTSLCCFSSVFSSDKSWVWAINPEFSASNFAILSSIAVIFCLCFWRKSIFFRFVLPSLSSLLSFLSTSLFFLGFFIFLQRRCHAFSFGKRRGWCHAAYCPVINIRLDHILRTLWRWSLFSHLVIHGAYSIVAFGKRRYLKSIVYHCDMLHILCIFYSATKRWRRDTKRMNHWSKSPSVRGSLKRIMIGQVVGEGAGKGGRSGE